MIGIVDSGRETNHACARNYSRDLASHSVKPHSPAISGDNPSTGPLGLLVRPPHLDLPLRTVIYRFDLSVSIPFNRATIGKS